MNTPSREELGLPWTLDIEYGEIKNSKGKMIHNENGFLFDDELVFSVKAANSYHALVFALSGLLDCLDTPGKPIAHEYGKAIHDAQTALAGLEGE
jgi:hypothetical protein